MKPANPLRILLVEDDELFRLGLQTRLQQETCLQVIAEAEDGETAVELTQQYLPDVVVLDVGLPGIGGIEACRQIKHRHPEIPILILTSHSQKSLIERLIAAGAQGYCLKGIAAENLVLAIRSVAAGASWWDKAATAEIRAVFAKPEPPKNGLTPTALENPLTKREQEILALVAAGKSNQEIAQILYIAQGTVRVHVHAILQKLEVRDRTQAAVLAIQKGLVAEELLGSQS
ncbi:MAG: response regulator transcription factor [Oscillatoriales cyanobacterium RU_3_3]|nr:response regulator transcription factor [Microcoleus sp. SU_5_6]NJL66314.1 response regulator transcription factor [Microcoleus sp. SM1_3_4]NJM59471.1 response regulator transcription factor [Oscillatoriales cyanobacterium RU_3_3]NJR23701.1 response regulator transcription factor [Richelia sp. CSU_2_1]